ncbi:hypothetical protein [Thermocrinis sp.]|uniref:hypothetical protein n=1 Tax=Thermocrinis sp. TaxID=2024383 RepID=UPI002FDD3F39
MKKVLSLLLMFLLIFPMVPVAKQVGAGPKISQEKQKTKIKTSQKHKKKKVNKKQSIRTAQNINKPQEGEILKIEGMVKDLNEQ